MRESILHVLALGDLSANEIGERFGETDALKLGHWLGVLVGEGLIRWCDTYSPRAVGDGSQRFALTESGRVFLSTRIDGHAVLEALSAGPQSMLGLGLRWANVPNHEITYWLGVLVGQELIAPRLAAASFLAHQSYAITERGRAALQVTP